jgi:hypothetical protein
LTQVVKENPLIQAGIISHCMQHLQFLSAQLAEQQLPEEVVAQMQQAQMQMQQVTPMEAQQLQMQMQMIIDQYASPIMAELSAQFLQSIGQGSSDADPLVAIRQQELALRDKELDQDQNQFAQKQAARAAEKAQDVAIDNQRIFTQQNIADDKLGLARDRLQQQEDLKLLEIGQNRGQ